MFLEFSRFNKNGAIIEYWVIRLEFKFMIVSLKNCENWRGAEFQNPAIHCVNEKYFLLSEPMFVARKSRSMSLALVDALGGVTNEAIVLRPFITSCQSRIVLN